MYSKFQGNCRNGYCVCALFVLKQSAATGGKASDTIFKLGSWTTFHSPSEQIWMDYFSTTLWEGNAATRHESKSIYAKQEESYHIMPTWHSPSFCPLAEVLVRGLGVLLEQPPKNSREIWFPLNWSKAEVIPSKSALQHSSSAHLCWLRI